MICGVELCDRLLMVFCDFYPSVGTTTGQLREAMEKLWLTDSSFTYETVTSDALGIGFRCGFRCAATDG